MVGVLYQIYLLTHSSLAVGLLGLFQAVPIVVTGLYGGAFADPFDRRRLQLIGRSLVATTSTALAIWAGVQRPWIESEAHNRFRPRASDTVRLSVASVSTNNRLQIASGCPVFIASNKPTVQRQEQLGCRSTVSEPLSAALKSSSAGTTPAGDLRLDADLLAHDAELTVVSWSGVRRRRILRGRRLRSRGWLRRGRDWRRRRRRCRSCG